MWWIVGFIAFIIVASISKVFNKETISEHRAEKASSGQMHAWTHREDIGFNLEVVGESFHYDTLELILGNPTERCEVTTTAVLIPYVHDKDPNAVRVEVNGKMIGHVGREDAIDLRKINKRHTGSEFTTTCAECRIGGGGLTPTGKKRPIGASMAVAELA